MTEERKRNKYTAAVFALFFGWTGAHQFYLGNKRRGLLYLGSFILGWIVPIFFILRWIPIILGLVDAVTLFLMSDKVFDAKYNNPEADEEHMTRNERRRKRRHRRRSRPDFERPSEKRREKAYQRSGAKKQPSVKSNPFKISGIRKFKDFDIKGALEDFKKGLELAPDDISLHFNSACSYSLLENAEKGYEHLEKAVALGFDDHEKINKHDSLAYLRIQPQWEEFVENGYSFKKQIQEAEEQPLEDDQLLTQLNKLAELREKGLITEEEFAIEKRKLRN